MKSIAALVVFVISMPGFLYAEEKKSSYAFSANAELGILYGTSYEIVYDSASSRRYLSELQWNIKPLFFAGLSAEIGPRNPLDRIAFFAELEIKAGLPGKTGAMEDRDWLYPVTVPESLTHFSSHENRTKAAFLADIGGGASFPLGKTAALKISLNFSYMYFKNEAWNGYIQYGPNGTGIVPYVPWQSDWPKEDIPGLVADYTQHWCIVSPAAALVVPGKRVSFSFSIALSPAVACIAFDNHFRARPPFLTNELMSGGIFLEPEGNFFFTFSDSFGIGLSASYRYIHGTRGDRYDTDTSTGTDTPWMRDIAGAGYRAFQGKAAFKITF
ncbi:MAG: omptin family outer membrane protease [Treponema sp.]|jgi:outer membrane protease|nr:omptin family outer membrane protease [Treponema sp.]